MPDVKPEHATFHLPQKLWVSAENDVTSKLPSFLCNKLEKQVFVGCLEVEFAKARLAIVSNFLLRKDYISTALILLVLNSHFAL